MRSLSAPMETLVIVNRPGPKKMATYKMADTLTAKRLTGTIYLPSYYVHYTLTPLSHGHTTGSNPGQGNPGSTWITFASVHMTTFIIHG